MEEIIILIFQFLFEVVIQILAELPWDWFIDSREHKSDEVPAHWKWATGSLVMGAVVGFVSLGLHSDTFIKTSGARIAYLVLAPPFSAWISLMLSRRMVRRGRKWVGPNLHALCSFCFALALTIIRFTYTHRPSL